jgi:hypothetical protein
MSRVVWRAAFGALRANRYMAYYYLFCALYTAQACGILLRRGTLISFLIVAFWFGFAWPIALMLVPSHRQLLRLPLSTREVGAAEFALRVLAPIVCLMLVLPLVGPVFAGNWTPAMSREMLALALGLSAAFPLLSLAPFLPLPAAYLRRHGYAVEGDARGLKWVAAAAVWLLAPAIALVPFVSRRYGFAEWPWVSLLLGLGSAALIFTQRERIALAALGPSAHSNSGTADGRSSRWRGWSGLLPLMLPQFGVSCALAAAMIPIAGAALLSVAAITLPLILLALSASTGAHLGLRCARALRQLPIPPVRLSALLLGMLLVPTMTGVLVGVGLVQWLHPHGLSLAHTALLCLLAVSCYAVPFAPILRSGRIQIQGPVFAVIVLLQVAIAIFIDRKGIALPPDAWLLGGSVLALALGLAWVTATVNFSAPRMIADSRR